MSARGMAVHMLHMLHMLRNRGRSYRQSENEPPEVPVLHTALADPPTGPVREVQGEEGGRGAAQHIRVKMIPMTR